MILDGLYVIGLIIVWLGNIHQVRRMIKTRSTKSLSLAWLWAMMFSHTIRLPRAVTSDEWVWAWGYVCSFILFVVLISVAIYHRKRYPKK